MILHLATRSDWTAAPADKPYVAASLASEGFIHCTAGDALMLQVANAFYRGQPGDFVVLDIDESKLTAELKWEAPADPKPAAGSAPPEAQAEFGEAATPAVPATPRPLFPHIYGPINRDAIVAVRDVQRDATGAFVAIVAQPAAPAQPDTPAAAVVAAAVGDPANPLNIKSPSQLANELLDATDGFSEALKRYKDKVESRIEGLDDEIKKKL